MTIYALSTPRGKSAIAIIRLSGKKTISVLEQITQRPIPPARYASLRKLYDPEHKNILDEALIIFFKRPHSYTGEDSAELHIHGGKAIIDSILHALSTFDDLRPAEAGEFSYRAVLNNRMDLTCAEGIADMIDAETKSQQIQSLRQMKGALGILYEKWRQRLMKALAHLETDIEFAEEYLPRGIGKKALKDILILRKELINHLNDSRGQTLREGIKIAIIGMPNTGKSSLLNYLVKHEAAIVSTQAGTTRDSIEVYLTLGGVPTHICDTAGIREAGNEIEQEGIRRAKKKAQEADIRLFISSPDTVQTEKNKKNIESLYQKGDFLIGNKSDLGSSNAEYHISIKTGENMKKFTKILETAIKKRFGLSEYPTLTRIRHRDSLTEALTALNRISEENINELVVEDIRLATRSLGKITGKVDIESLLDIVFHDFCIGK